MRQKLGTDALVLASGVAVLSAGSIFARLADLPPLATAFLRCLFAVAILGCWAAASRRLAPLDRKSWGLAVGSGVFLALHLGSWIASLGMVSVAMSLLLLSTAPLWSMAFGAALGIEPFHKGQAGAVALSFLGVLVIAMGSWSAPGTLLGGGLAIASGIAMAGYTLCAKSRGSGEGLESYALASYGVSSLSLGAAALALGQLIGPLPLESLGWVAAMALGSQVIGHTTVNWAAGRLGAVTVGQVLLLEPVIASALAWLVFREQLGPALAGGGALVLAGAVLSIRLQGAALRGEDGHHER